MNKPVRVVTVGAATQDVFLSGQSLAAKRDVRTNDYVEQFPLGAKLEVEQVYFETGGGGTNTAVTFARQGFQVSFWGKVGHDAAGAEVIRVLRREGVATNRVAFDTQLNTGYSAILLAPKGERTVLSYRGASHHLSARDFPIRQLDCDWLYISSLAGNIDLLERLLKQANDKGIEVAFNPGAGELADTKALKALLPYVRILTANRQEYAKLFGDAEPTQTMRTASHFVQYAVMTDGPRGSFATDGASFYKCGQYQKVPVFDRTGSGDGFASGFVAALAQGQSIEAALTLGSANATGVVQAIGAKPGILQSSSRLKRLKVEVTSL
jgi:ribokinase